MKILSCVLALILAVAMAGESRPAAAQAYGVTFTTTILYQNPTTNKATQVNLIYFDSTGSKEPLVIPRPDFPAGKTTSYFIGTLDQPSAGFHGTTYVQSNPRLVSIQLQTPPANSPLKVRPITNLPLYGSPTVWIASVLRNQYGANTTFQFQNIDSQSNLVQMRLYDIHATLVHSTTVTLESGETFIFDASSGQNNPLPEQFSGSALLSASRPDRTTPGKIIGSALELDSAFYGARSFEGLGHGALEIYMPSAACNFDIGGGVLLNTVYAVQNSSLNSPTEVTLRYTNGITQTQTIGPGSKGNFTTCQAPAMPANFLGAAKLTSRTTPIVAVGKAYGGGISTAFTGALGGTGAQNLALPYVRWANERDWNNGSQSRTFIAIQNVSPQTIQGNLVVYFYPCQGKSLAYAIPLAPDGLAEGEKIVLKPSDAAIDQFGACSKGPQVSGSIIIAGPENSRLAAVVRVQQWDPAHQIVVGEDYNALNAP